MGAGTALSSLHPEKCTARSAAADGGTDGERSQRMLQTIDPLAMAAFARSRQRQVVTNSEIAAVRVPVLAVVGSLDPALAGVNELKAAMSSLKVVVIEGASHSSADERGAPRRPEFVNAIREFVAAHKSP